MEGNITIERLMFKNELIRNNITKKTDKKEKEKTLTVGPKT